MDWMYSVLWSRLAARTPSYRAFVVEERLAFARHISNWLNSSRNNASDVSWADVMDMESSVAVAVEFEKKLEEAGMNDEDRSCSLMKCVAKTSRTEMFDSSDSIERSSDSVRIVRDEHDVIWANSWSAGWEKGFLAIESYSWTPRDCCWDNGRRRRVVELETPSSFDDEDDLRRTSSYSVRDNAPSVDRSQSMSACASMDRVVDAVELVQVLSPVHCFHIPQHSVNANLASPWSWLEAARNG